MNELDTEDVIERRWRRYAILWVIVAATFLVLAAKLLPGCSTSPKSKGGAGGGGAPVSCEGLEAGATRETKCEDGTSKIEVCTSDGIKVARWCPGEEPPPPSSCDDDAVSFADVKPILSADCASCHAGYDTFQVAKGKIDAFIARTQKGDGDPQRMPKPPSPPLEQIEKDLLKGWKDGGLKEKSDCPVTGGPGTPGGAPAGFVSLDKIETAILDDLTKIDPTERADYRYLVAAHRLNAGADVGEMATLKKAADKTLHAVSVERDSYPVEEIAPGIYRANVEELGIDAAKWLSIEAADKLKIESFTTKGVVIKTLIGGGVTEPWVHVDNFSDTVLHNATLYYDLNGISATFNQYMLDQGVDFAGDLLTEFDAQGNVINRPEARLIGLPDSPLAPQHNRLMIRHDSEEGYCWTTQDTGAQDIAQKNLNNFPLPAETGTATPFVFVASETICIKKNGQFEFALWNAAGVRQDKAPIDVVRDFVSPVSAEIQNAVSCFGCHGPGILSRLETVRDQVIANASQFLVADVNRVKETYPKAAEAATIFAKDNATFADGIRKLGISPQDPEPVSTTNFKFLLAWDAKKTAAFLLLTEAELKECVNGSAVGRVQAGQLLVGGSITFDQLVQVLPVLKTDCNLFRDPIGA